MSTNEPVPAELYADEPLLEERVDDDAVETERDSIDVIPTYDITSYGADFSVDGIVNRLKNGDIDLPPFQRGFVWNSRQSARFIESLLLGLPVPGIFLYMESDSNKLIVIDGQQRLRTLQAFYTGKLRGRDFALPKRETSRYQSIHPRFEGKSYSDLEDEDRRRLDNAIIHATVVRQYSPKDSLTSVYHIFERINSGGTRLQPQEIRNAIYGGSFRELLQELDENEDWRAIFGAQSKRFKDQELILRFAALHYGVDDYSRPMTDFLNDFMATNRDLKTISPDDLSTLFAATVGAINGALGREAFRPVRTINAAVFDAVMVGVAKRIEAGGADMDLAALRDQYEAVLANEKFQEAYLRATSDRVSVQTRVMLAVQAFAEVP